MTPFRHGSTPDRDADPTEGQESADELERALSVMRRRAPEPPADLVDRAVLRAVQARAAAVEQERTSLRRFARPAGTLALLTLTAIGAVLVVQRYRSAPPTLQAAAAHTPAVAESAEADVSAPVPVRFVLPAAGAREVAVAGEFNGWDASRTPLNDDDGDGVFHTTLSLERGAYAYMFVVDGERWVTDPFADAYRDDGFGNRNAVLRIP